MRRIIIIIYALSALVSIWPVYSSEVLEEKKLSYKGHLWEFQASPGASWIYEVDSVTTRSRRVEFDIADEYFICNADAASNLMQSKDRESGFAQKFVKWQSTGFFAVFKDLYGAGYVVLLDEVGRNLPQIHSSETGISVTDAAQLKIKFFEEGGYLSAAREIREWQRQKGLYRSIYEKPMAEEMRGLVHIRPIQHGAISQEVWEKVQHIVPKAFFVWRLGRGPNPAPHSPADGQEKFPPEFQKQLDSRGSYLFMPWCGVNPLVSPEAESVENPWANYAFDTMPRSFLEEWRLIGEEGIPYLTAKQKEAGRSSDSLSGLLCPHSLSARMERWIEKVEDHPYCFRVDGVNIDTLVGFTRPNYYFGGCFSKNHPADYRDYVDGLAEMCKVAFDKGLMVGHEGNAYWLEKYCLSTYGKGMVSVGLYTGWYLKPMGPSKDPEKVISMVTRHLPINAMVYHDQLALRLHDAEALNIRFADKEQYDMIRRFKLTFNALYGLTPNLHFAGIDADKLIMEDISWMENDIPRAVKTYETLYGLQITNHRFLTEDRMVQKTVFGDRIEVIANFKSHSILIRGHDVAELDYVLIEK